MKKYFLTANIVLTLFISLCHSQIANNKFVNKSSLPVFSGEKISLHTDRNLYCVNERIFFSAFYSKINEMENLEWSNILYIELIRWNGDKIVQSKFRLLNDNASGYLTIPNDLPSGTYYLRAYTKWMQNYTDKGYPCTSIKIVNPFISEIDKGPDTKISEKKSIDQTRTCQSNGITCYVAKNHYGKREKVDIEIHLSKKMEEIENISISVVKEGCIDTTVSSIDNISPNKDKEEICLPDLRGVSITGRLFDKKTKNPLGGILMNLSIPISKEYFSSSITNEKGEFYFTLPDIYGEKEFYIKANTDEKIEAEIEIDNDFCEIPIALPYIPFELNGKEEKLAMEMAINMQLSAKYQYTLSKSNKTDNLPFYGKARNIYITQKYIELPNLEEFFFEIVKGFNVLYYKKNPYLKLDYNARIPNIEPLILIDNIPVLDQVAFLKLPLYKIERVEIIDRIYRAGEIYYNGLISVYSKNNDFAGIELDKNSMFFKYELLSNQATNFLGDSNENNDSYEPDIRNTLYWNPNIKISVNKPTKVTFITSDDEGAYIIFIKGMDKDSKKPIFSTYKFNVK